MAISLKSGSFPREPFWPLLGAFLLVSLGIMLMDGPPAASFAWDADDIARKLQIADLLRDGNWHDLTWPFVEMPGQYVSPWSRLVDCPYVLVTWALSPFMDQQQAFGIARFIVPPLWLLAYAALAVSVMMDIAGPRLRALPVAAAAFASLLAIPEFYPGRIDHHNVQLVLMLMLFLGLVSSHRNAGILVGAASFLSIAVGLECAPFVVVAIAGLGIAAAWTGDRVLVRRLKLAGFTLFLGALPASLVLIGPRAIATVQCDTLSAPWISALCAGGLVLALVPRAWRRDVFSSPLARLTSLAVPGAVLLAILWLAIPLCHDGPFTMIGPVARQYWFSRIFQEHWLAARYAEGGAMSTIFVPIFLTGILIAAWLWARPKGAGPVLVFLVACTALALTVLQTRYFRFPAAFVPLFLPIVINAYRGTSSPVRKLLPLAVPVVCALALVGTVKRGGIPVDIITYMDRDTCRDADLSLLNTLPAGRIMAPLGLSSTLAAYNVETGLSLPVAALPFHRASPGVTNVIRTFILADSEDRRRALAPYDYVAVCRADTDEDPNLAPVFARLVAGGEWPGLVDVSPSNPSRLRVMRVDHDALR